MNSKVAELFNIQNIVNELQISKNSDPLLNKIFMEFNNLLKELFDSGSNEHIFQS